MKVLWSHLEECYGFLPIFRWSRVTDSWLKRKLVPYVFPQYEHMANENMRLIIGIQKITSNMPQMIVPPILVDGHEYSKRKIDDILYDLICGKEVKF